MRAPFCGPHAREQEERFTLGQLARAQGLVAEWERRPLDLGDEPLVEALEPMQWVARTGNAGRSEGPAERQR